MSTDPSAIPFELLEDRRLLFATSIHEDLTSDALSFLNTNVLAEISDEHLKQDTLDQFVQSNHFDGSHFFETAANINQWYLDAVAAADPANFNSDAVADAFGNILHASQDFYAHSNWAELQQAELLAPLELIDRGGQFWDNLAPYSIHSGAMLVQGENELPFGPGSSLTRQDSIITVDTAAATFPGVISGSVNPLLYGGDDTPDSIALSHGGLTGVYTYLVFTTVEALLPLDTNGAQDVYLRDRLLETLVLVSTNTAGTGSGNDDSHDPVISADGQVVAFTSWSSDLDPLGLDTDSNTDIYVRSIAGGSTRLISAGRDGTSSGNADSSNPLLSADGHIIAFRSFADNFVPNDIAGNNVFLAGAHVVKGVDFGNFRVVNAGVDQTAAGGDGDHDFDDIDGFVSILTGQQTATVLAVADSAPEVSGNHPSADLLLGLQDSNAYFARYGVHAAQRFDFDGDRDLDFDDIRPFVRDIDPSMSSGLGERLFHRTFDWRSHRLDSALLRDWNRAIARAPGKRVPQSTDVPGVRWRDNGDTKTRHESWEAQVDLALDEAVEWLER